VYTATYSNLENHPRLIRARDPKPVFKILLDPRTGLPPVVDPTKTKSKSRGKVESIEEDDEDEDEDEEGDVHLPPGRSQTITRPRDESKEARKARKTAVKAERQARRADKKAAKELFGAELKAQMRTIGNKERKVKKL
jgi:protein LTV1